jgi:hypothetical protein
MVIAALSTFAPGTGCISSRSLPRSGAADVWESQGFRPKTGSMLSEPLEFTCEHDWGQAWFWTPEWQIMEQEVEDDLAHGRYEDFESMDDFIASLRDTPEDR